MSGGAAATSPAIGVNAPRNIWAGFTSVRSLLLEPCHVHFSSSDHRPPCRPSSPPLVVSSSVMIPVTSPVSRLWRTGCVRSGKPIPSPGCVPSSHPNSPSSSPSCPLVPFSGLSSLPLRRISSVGDGPSSSLSSSSLLVLPCKPLLPPFLSSSWVVSSLVGAWEWFRCWSPCTNPSVPPSGSGKFPLVFGLSHQSYTITTRSLTNTIKTAALSSPVTNGRSPSVSFLRPSSIMSPRIGPLVLRGSSPSPFNSFGVSFSPSV